MKFWTRVLTELERGPKTFESVFKIIGDNFGTNIFSECIVNNRIEKTTYFELIKRAESVCSGLKKTKEIRSEFVGIFMQNSPDFVAVFWGTLMAGHKPLLISTRANSDTVNAVMYSSGCKVCIVDKTVINENDDGVVFIEAATLIDNVFGKEDVCWANEIALHTSGTTGKTKIAVYSGEAICAEIAIADYVIKIDPSIKNGRKVIVRQLALLPFYHVFGLIATLLWFSFFGRTFIFPPSYDSAGVKLACKRLGVTHFFAVPLVWESVAVAVLDGAKKKGKEKIFRFLLKLSNKLQSIFPSFGKFVARNILFKSVRKEALGTSLNYLISGGGAINAETLFLLNGLGYSIHNGYGMTEAGIVSVELSKKANRRNKSSVGAIFKNIDFKLDEQNVLHLKGQMLCTAIIENGIRTDRMSDEWLKTRDIVSIKKGNAMTVLSRCDDVIIGSDGENIYPDEIERYFNTPGISGICAVGIQDKISAGDKIIVCVSLDEQLSGSQQTGVYKSLNRISDSIPLGLKPADILIIKQFPVNDIGKIKRAGLKKLIESDEIEYIVVSKIEAAYNKANASNEFKDTLQKIKHCFSKVMNLSLSEITDECNFLFDLGGSSLQYYSLLNEIAEQTGANLLLSGNVSVTPLDFANAITKIY